MKTKKYQFVLLVLCAVYLCLYNTELRADRDTLTIMGGVGLAQYVLSYISWRAAGKQLISPYFIFLSVMYVFLTGQSLLYPFGLVCEDRDLYETYTSLFGFGAQEIYRAQVQTLLSLAVFHIAGLRYARKKPARAERAGVPDVRVRRQKARMKRLGWTLFAVSIVPFVYDTVSDMIQSMTYGYGSLYGTNVKIGWENALSFVAALFVPSVICLFIVYRDKRGVRLFLTGLLLLVVLAVLMTGGRSNAVIILSLLAILYQYLVKPFTKKALLVGAVGGFFFLQVLAYIADTRTSRRSFEVDTAALSDNAAVNAVAEMGWTQLCLIKCMQIVPEEQGFRYGKSYLYSLTTVIPNMGFWRIHPAKREAVLGDWLTDYLGVNFGTGFSMTAEAWVNFGVFGFLVFYIWGAVLGRLFGRIEETMKRGDIALLAFLLIIFWFCLKIPRNNFVNVVRAVCYYAAPIYFYCNNFRLRSK